MVVMTTWGMGVGTTMSLFSLVMVKFMGIENLAPTYGGTSLFLSIGFITIGPLVGESSSLSLFVFPMWLPTVSLVRLVSIASLVVTIYLLLFYPFLSLSSVVSFPSLLHLFLPVFPFNPSFLVFVSPPSHPHPVSSSK